MALTDRFETLTPAMRARMPVLSRAALELAFTLATWQMRSATRQSLRRLDCHLLRDIGLEPDVAQGESTKRFWQG